MEEVASINRVSDLGHIVAVTVKMKIKQGTQPFKVSDHFSEGHVAGGGFLRLSEESGFRNRMISLVGKQPSLPRMRACLRLFAMNVVGRHALRDNPSTESNRRNR